MIVRLDELIKKSDDETIDCILDGAGIEYEEIEDSGWTDEGKYSYREVVMKIEGKYYEFTCSRSGSYYSDYYNSVDSVGEVVKVEDTQTITIICNPITKNLIEGLLEDNGVEFSSTFAKGWD